MSLHFKYSCVLLRENYEFKRWNNFSLISQLVNLCLCVSVTLRRGLLIRGSGRKCLKDLMSRKDRLLLKTPQGQNPTNRQQTLLEAEDVKPSKRSFNIWLSTWFIELFKKIHTKTWGFWIWFWILNNPDEILRAAFDYSKLECWYSSYFCEGW